ncbi:unnamed protein product [Schistosoma mattheei]|uniref:Uncharacterized protein n=1 Tax=Schistosoma mattheei TaxID=31246 RepID=A0A183PI80_9TREM|nr:unnamed protein product [Schistosoma mattheei]
MNLENAGLQDRVIDLEKRSAEQANELACLRSSLADCLRRLNLLESARGMKLHSSSQRPVLHNNASTHKAMEQCQGIHLASTRLSTQVHTPFALKAYWRVPVPVV